MRCSACGHANTSDARFCAQCGTGLSRTCPACDHAVEPDARFCSACGTSLLDDEAPRRERDLERYVPEALLHKIRAARAGGAMRGERRTVTMLFADIQGSTAAAERLDPEEWAEIVNGAFEHLIAPVYRYEGTLARLQGDAILAFFGAPVAHEDDAIRAVRSGLDMLEAIRDYAADVQRESGVPIAIRVGINTGLVVVGEVGSDLRVEYTALGDAINVAARMEQLADPGTVLITDDTAGLLDHGFILTEMGPVDVKGRTGPVIAFRVDGVAADEVADDTAPPLVGRDRERAAVSAALERLVDGVGGIVTIVGEAGIGKSRLLASVRHEAEAAYAIAATSDAAGELAWLDGHCRSFDTGVPYAPFLDLAARWLDVDLTDEVTFDRIAEMVTRALGGPDADMSTFLAHVAGAPLPPEPAALVAALETPTLHAKTTDAIVGYLEAEANRWPLVIALDDLHWADALSLGLTERLIASAEHVPLTLVLSLRPVREEPAWRLVELASREAAHRHTHLHLDALEPAAADALLEVLLGDRQVSAEERQRILERADGNPLFVEELAGSVREHGAPDVPTSLAGLLSARLDRLDDDGRLVAEVAAVAGREFEAAAVAELADGIDVDTTLRELVRQGVLVERRRRPTPLYAFRHALIQEAAYNIVLLRDRRVLHGRLARYLERIEADLPHDIARHHLASDTPSAAFPWLVEAGVRASRAMSLAEAIRLFTTALDHLPPDASAEEVARAHIGLGEAYSLVPDLDHASAAYQSLADLGRRTGQPSLEVRALNRLGINAAAIGADFSAAHEYLGAAKAVAEEAGDEVGLAEYHMNACFIAVAQGELTRAIEHDTETARLGAASGVDEVRVSGLVRRVMNLVSATDFERVDEALEEARRVAAEVGSDAALAVLAAHVDAVLLRREGDLVGSLELLTTASETLERYGSFYTAITQAQAGRLALSLGRVDMALAMLSAALRTAERDGQPFATSLASATMSRIHALCGDVPGSDRFRAQALETLARPLGEFLASSVWADLGIASMERGSWSDAEADVALGLQASSSSRFLERPQLLAGAARVAFERGDLARARQLTDEASAHAGELALRMFAPLVASIAASLSRAEGDLAGADERLARAEADAGWMGMRLLACDIVAARADVAAAEGRDDDEASHLARRDRWIEEIAGDVADPDLRAGLIRRLQGTPRHAPTHPTTSP
ncbi:adenylate/guanylate cyclase domain-containing protein [Nitriliruptor alkaliphilus]|uniref:adenylate/guanylate cyclase domain-containing protein n=1 Tax=Nitriliruptor alkaliphilus TaxID=427918 RepID=UPI0006988D1D|nr:adenylate/guanylate cyclase domain-containing protein [Nitriliruptor alkaliphilus]